MIRSILLAACFSLTVHAASIDPAFAGAYTAYGLGTVEGVPFNYGGLTFLNNSTLLLGARANNSDASIKSVAVNRDVNGHIISFGEVSHYASAPFIDGGLAFGPGGVLFATSYSNNTLMQFKPGSTAPDKTIELSPLAEGTNSTGTLQFVPGGFPGAGNFLIGSYSGTGWYTGLLTEDGFGTYNLSDLTLRQNGVGGPEGIIYVPIGSPLFETPTALVSEYAANRVRAYALDAFGAPVTSSGVDFISDLLGAEGAVIDPVTGDFLFSTFGGGSQIIQIQGFVAPVSETPEPTTLLLAGVALVALGLNRKLLRK